MNFYLKKCTAAIAVLTLFNVHIAFPKGWTNITGPIPQELKVLTAQLSNKNQPNRLKFPKGTLLVGPSGSGKTQVAQALKDELEPNQFMYAKASDFLMPSDITDLFREARRKAGNTQCVLFIDEFDVFAKEDFDSPGKSEIREKVVTLMNEMDGFERDDSVIVIAATQTANFHKSLLRSGRFSQTLEIGYPDATTRAAMLKNFNAEQLPFDRTIDINAIAKLAYNFTPADLKLVVYRANVLASSAKTTTITQSQLAQAFLDTLQSKSRSDKSLLVRLQVAKNLLLKNKQEAKGFDRIIGTIPHDIKELVEQLKRGAEYSKFNIQIPKGFLFTGPPGTGKTTLARALAEEANCEFMTANGADFVQPYLGAGGDTIKNLFKEARDKAANSESGKTILFIDEIDALGKRQGDLMDSTITALLTEMDGFAEDESVIVIAASNHPKNLDPALLRPGRFNKIITVPLPDLATRELLLKHYIKAKPYNAQTINLKTIAEATNNHSPADIKELIEKAATLALKEKAQQVELPHIIAAIKQGLQEKLLKGETGVQQQIDALDVIFNGKATTKGFNQIIGGVPQEIQDLADMMKGDIDYASYGIPYPKGILFTGPPGTGKTLLAKALAEQIGCEFIETKGSAFVEQYVGVGAQRVRELFNEAREKAKGNRFGKTIIFIDELDSIGSRSGGFGQSEETTRTITELLAQMDGFSKDESVIVIGATNNPSAIDKALLRAGRFDTILEIGLPDLKKRTEILQSYAKKIRRMGNVAFDQIAERLAGCNAADLKELVNKAAAIAMHSKAPNILLEHFEQALEIIKHNHIARNNRYV